MVLAHAVVAQSRIDAAAEAGNDVTRISFGKTLAMVRSLWVVLSVGHGIIDSGQASELTRQVLAYLADTIVTILEADADGSLHLPVPPELRRCKVRVEATLEVLSPVDESVAIGNPQCGRFQTCSRIGNHQSL